MSTGLTGRHPQSGIRPSSLTDREKEINANDQKGAYKMIRKSTLAAIVLILILCFAMPAAAETFTSQDGVFSIELPSESWKEIVDPTKWIALSDGGNVITVEHYSNGEKLPDMSVANSHYVNVYQAVFSTQNEVFIITGSVVDAANIPEIAQSIISAKVLKYDTKLAVGKEDEVKVSEFSIVPMDKTMYVTADWLNVRTGCSTDELTIGGLEGGTAVQVLGSVQRNGSDIGWYQVAYGSGTGYVSSSFLSDTPPESQKDPGSDTPAPSDPSYSGNVKTVFDEDGNAYTLYECTDGYWRDRSGTQYVEISDTEFQVYEGTKRLSVYYPDQDDDDDDDDDDDGVVYAQDENGQSYTLYEGADGIWRDNSGTEYVQLSDTEFQVKDGNKHLTAY